ncbi:MAG TPA: protoporphyrinogen oxidase [candidate division Zixibacteria bacterium]|nr:protoporphyrinogen oxidase [candidate division Zixibacteria bacterium]
MRTLRIAVVGGGIAGLAAAHRLIELKQERSLPLEVVLLEASRRLGGSIATERVGGFLVEAGPDSFITEKPWAFDLCRRLGLESHLVPARAEHRKIYVVHRGRLEPLPEGFFLLAPTRARPFLTTPLFSWRGKIRIAAELVVPRRRAASDETLASFVRRRFGKELLERVAQPLIGGIYASDPERLSLEATMPRLAEMERAKRSVIRAIWSEQRRKKRGSPGSGARWGLFVTLENGMQELVDALASRLPEGSVHLGRPARHLVRGGAGTAWMIRAGESAVYEADGVIVAAPAHAAADLLAMAATEAAVELRTIPYVSTATVNLAYRRADLPRPLDAFGFVVPAVEKRAIIACTFCSVKYPGRAPEDGALLRAFVGGALQPEAFRDDDATMEAKVRNELRELVGIEAPPLFRRVWRHARSMPQYELGHGARIERVRNALSALPGIALAGSAYGGVGISDCVRTGEEAAERLLRELA